MRASITHRSQHLRPRRAALALAPLLAMLAAVVAAPGASAATMGALTQKSGAAGCISDGGDDTCADGRALWGAESIAVSPDGMSAYVASNGSDAVALFDRSASTGALTQKPGTAGCISSSPVFNPTCAEGRVLAGGRSITLSPDGKNVYVAASSPDVGGPDSVAVFDRNTSTGALTQKVGANGCIEDEGGDGCADGRGLWGVNSIAVSPDGKSAYAASEFSGAVTVFDRNISTGALTQKAGTQGCIAYVSDEGCAVGRGLGGARSVRVSPDGKSVYVASDMYQNHAVAILDRDTSTGALTQKAGAAGCIEDEGRDGCADGRLTWPQSLAVSPDGKSVYVPSKDAASLNFYGSLTIFDRNATTGALAEKAGTAGCVSGDGSGGCAVGSGLFYARSMTVSPDGDNAYVAGGESVAVFDRTATGALAQPAGTAACIGSLSEGCAEGRAVEGKAFDGDGAIAVSPDGKNAYVTDDRNDAVAILDRGPVSGNGDDSACKKAKKKVKKAKKKVKKAKKKVKKAKGKRAKKKAKKKLKKAKKKAKKAKKAKKKAC